MKKRSKKNKSKETRGASTIKKASYIGAGVAAVVGLIGLVTVLRISDIHLTLEENPSVTATSPSPLTTLPQTPVSTAKPTPAAAAETMPTASPEPVAPAVAAVAAQPEPPSLVMPAEGEVIMPFSAERLIKSKTMGDWRVHSGIDIRAAAGAEVKAAADGVVERAYQDPQMGFTIILAHDGAFKTVYQNLASVEMVKVGDTLTQGQGIAAVGNSAAAEMLEESHLHFAVLEGTSYQDPMDYIR